MYISITQIERSLYNLKDMHPFFGMSFLAFKKARLPVGRTQPIVFSQLAVDILNLYYKPASTYDGFYNPFHSSKPKERWVKPRYYDTSMQRWTFDTFGDALIHQKGSPARGWRSDYIVSLVEEASVAACVNPGLRPWRFWLFRNVDWANGKVEKQIVDRLIKVISDYRSGKIVKLFDISLPSLPAEWVEAFAGDGD